MKPVIKSILIGAGLLSLQIPAYADPGGDLIEKAILAQVQAIRAGVDNLEATAINIAKDVVVIPPILNEGLLVNNDEQNAEFAGEIKTVNDYQAAQEQQTATSSNVLVNQFSGVSKTASTDASSVYGAPGTYCDDSKNCYSTLSSLSLYAPVKYSSAQEKAAQGFLQNASGAGFALQAPPQEWYGSPNSAIQQYVAYYKTLSAAHSIAINSYAQAMASRQSADQNTQNESPRGHLERLSFFMYLTDDFQQAFAKLPVLGRLYSMDEKASAELIALHEMNNTLENINANLNALNTIQTIQAQYLVGPSLYTQAQQASHSNVGTQNQKAIEQAAGQ